MRAALLGLPSFAKHAQTQRRKGREQASLLHYRSSLFYHKPEVCGSWLLGLRQE
jgi:hypothetical protein